MFAVILFPSYGMAQEDENGCELQIKKKAQKLFDQAIDELKRGGYYECSRLLAEATDEQPEFVKAWWVIADVNNRPTNRIRNVQKAIDAYKMVIDLCPSYEDYYAYFYLAKLCYDKQDFPNAYLNFEAFLSAKTDKIQEKHFNEAQKMSAYSKFYADILKNKVPFEPKKLQGVSTDLDEYLAVITPDNDFIYFTRKMPEKRIGAVGSGDARIERFVMAQRSNGIFNIGAPLDYPFNQQPNEGGASLTVDNRELFYTRCVLLPNKYFNCDISYSKFENGRWSEIDALPIEINTQDSWESMPTISSDGNTLIFISDRAGGLGGYDLYYSQRNEEGKWSKATNMGPVINTAGNEKAPFLHSDSKTLYFSSSDRYDDKLNQTISGHMGLGGFDIFFTRMDDKGQWAIPKNLGSPINTENNELGFFVSTDGKTGYFTSNSLNGDKSWDIYYFDLYPDARPQKVLLIKGTLKEELSNEIVKEAVVEIKNIKTKEISEIPVNKETGEYAAIMLFNSDFTMTVKKEGYTYVTKYIAEDAPEYQIPIKVDIKMKPIQIGKAYTLDEIYFDSDSDNLTEQSKKVIDGFVEFLSENPKVKIEIQGHTDDVGSDEYNNKLSANRAHTVYNILVEKGIENSRLNYKGYGESQPIADNKTEEGRKMNRRTIFVIIEK